MKCFDHFIFSILHCDGGFRTALLRAQIEAAGQDRSVYCAGAASVFLSINDFDGDQ